MYLGRLVEDDTGGASAAADRSAFAALGQEAAALRAALADATRELEAADRRVTPAWLQRVQVAREFLNLDAGPRRHVNVATRSCRVENADDGVEGPRPPGAPSSRAPRSSPLLEFLERPRASHGSRLASRPVRRPLAQVAI